MELFTKLERDWNQAAQKKDSDTLNTLLAPEFMLRNSENSQDPVPRATWIRNAITMYDVRSFSPKTMAIRAFLGVAAVSFIENDREVVDGQDRTVHYFIVDLWEVNHGKWQAAARYVSPLGKDLPGSLNAGRLSH